MEQTDKLVIRNLILCTALGVILSRFSIGSVLMTVPALLVCYRVRQNSIKIASFSVMLLGVGVWTLIGNRMLLGTEYAPLILFSMYLPFILIVGSAVWAVSSSYSKSSMRKFFWACIPVFIAGLAFSLYFASDASKTVRDAMVQTVLLFFPEEMLSSEMTSAVRMIVDGDVMRLIFAPAGILLLAIPIVISDVNLHKFDEEWQYDFANMKLPDGYVWVFFVSWIAALVCRVVKSVPVMVHTIAWSVALSMTVLYFVVGVSILMAFMRKRTAVMTAGKVVFMVAFACFIPGINFAVFLILPLLGVLETWVKLR